VLTDSRKETVTMTDQILTPRQREIVELVANGYTRDQIARKLGISPRTVTQFKMDARHRVGYRLGVIVPSTPMLTALCVKYGEIDIYA